MTLSYDCTVLAMLSIGLRQECPSVYRGRCRVNPAKKCLFADCEGESFRLAGAVSVIMTYYKLQDTIEDSGILKKIGAGLLRVLMKRGYKKAARAYPELDKDVNTMMQRQWEVERADSGVDEAADPTARLLAGLCRRLAGENPDQQRLLESFGYYLGRWVYIMDAADDLEKDIRHGNFNPFRRNWQEDSRETMLYCNNVLNMTVSQLILAYDLLKLHAYQEILDNLVHYGLSWQQKYCLFDRKKDKKERKRQKKRQDYYSYLSRGDQR